MGQGTKTSRNPRKLRFGDFTIDVQARELHRNGSRIRLQDQPLQVLALLTQRAGEVVTREELRQHLWPADTFVDFDNSLNASVAKIREGLGDSPEAPRFIETLPRRGYRFIASVKPCVEVSDESQPSAIAVAAGSPSEQRRVKWVILAVVGLTMVLLGVVFLVRQSPRSPRITRYIQITNDGIPKARSVSFINILVSDGARIYFSSGTENDWNVAQVSVNGGQAVAVPTPLKGVVVNDISRDRSKLLITRSEGTVLNAPLWFLPLPGGPAQRLGNLRAHGATWSRDGKLIAYCNDQDLYIANADGSDPRKLARLNGIPFQPQWSPDGRTLRFYLYDTTRDSGTLWEILADGSNPHPLFPNWQAASEACCGVWTPDGKYFVFQATHDGVTSIWALPEGHGLFRNRTREPVQLTLGPMNFLGPSPSMDGRQLYAIGEQKRGELMRYDSVSHQFVTYFSGLSAEGLDFSRDGNWVTYTTYPEGTLWRSRTDGTQRLPLTNSSMRAGMPRWSPDGKQIAFMGMKPGKGWKAYLVSSSGGSPEQLISGKDSEWHPDWSPNGDSVIFGQAWWLPNPAIRVLDLRTQRVSALPGSEGMFFPRWSPNGRFVAAVTKNSRKLMLFDFISGKWSELISRDSFGFLSWSRNSEYIYFDAATKDGAAFYRTHVRRHAGERVAKLGPPIALAFGLFGPWTGLAPDDSPLLMRDTSIQEIYALDWQLP